MMTDGGKIKFGFSKIIKKSNLINQNGENATKTSKIDMIQAIEGTSMKILGKDPDDIEKKLVIPMTNDQKTTPLSKLLLNRKHKIRSIKIEPSNGTETKAEIKQEPLDETLDQQAARELMEDLQNKEVKSEVKVFELPIHPDDLPLEGAKESTLDDYDQVPIADFGKAMLRGMGWKDEDNKEDSSKLPMEGPVLRPKGMGLGADKVIKKQPLLVPPTHSETLEIKRNACVKVLAGKHKNFYGTIEGFDDGGGRVIVKLAIGGLRVTLNEFMVQPISKQEFAQYGKVLNSVKYEVYKSGDVSKIEPPTSSVKKEESSKVRRKSSTERHQKYARERSRSEDKHDRHKSNDKRAYYDRSENSTSARKYRGRSRSREKRSKRKDSTSSDDYKRKSSKSKRKHSTPDSRGSSENERKHKKKTKKSKRKRDRS